MKKSLIFIIAVLLLTGVNSLAETDIPIENPQLTLSGNSVDLKFDLAGPATGKEAKILFGDLADPATQGFDENTTIQPYMYWYQQVPTGRTTVKEMVSQGWDLRQIFWITSSQAYFYFVR